MNNSSWIRAFALGLVVLLCSTFASADDELDRRWIKWLEEEVVYIISEREVDLFNKLENNEQRESFVEQFWLERDPTPGTKKNELKEEHEKRVAYATKFFGRDSLKPGWQTDRGKMYIILGEPKERKRFPSGAVAFPCELWFYEADPARGIPPFFYLIFFKHGNIGELILYRHGMHTPRHLTGNIEAGQNQYGLLRNVDSELAHAAFSYLLDENPSYTDIYTSIGSIMLLTKIENTKNVGVDVAYAERILAGQAEVTTEYAFVDTSIAHTFAPYVDPLGNAFVDYSFLILPEQMSMGQHDDTFYGALRVEAFLSDSKGNTILTNTREIEINVNEKRFSSMKSSPMIFMDRMACVPGDYTLALKVTNKVEKNYFLISGSVQFSNANPSRSNLGSLILAADMIDPQAGMGVRFHPFAIYTGSLIPDPLNTFPQQQPPFLYCQMYHPATTNGEIPAPVEVNLGIVDSDGESIGNSTAHYQQDVFNEHGIYDFYLKLPLSSLSPGRYRVNLEAKFGGEKATRSATLNLVDSTIPRAFLLRSPDQPLTQEATFLEYASMMQRFGDIRRAKLFLDQALSFQPDSKAVRLQLAEMYVDIGEFQLALDVLQPLLAQEPNEVTMLRLVAGSYFGLGEFSKSAKFLERLRLQTGDTIETLNQLAGIYARVGDSTKAKQLWQKSLEIDPEQPAVKENINSLK